MPDLDLAALERETIIRCWRDAEFQKQVVNDAKNTLQQVLDDTQPGVALPEQLAVTALAETTDQYYLVIPPLPVQMNAATATDEELDGVLFKGSGMTGCVTRTHTPMS